MRPRTTLIPYPSLSCRLAANLLLAMLVLIVGMLLPIDPVHAATISIEPHRTFLLTNNDSSGGPSIPIELMSLGLSSGNIIQLERLGDFRPGVSYSDTSTKMIGVFSASSTLLGSSTLHRVPDAIDAGEDLVTPSTFFGGYSTDIPQDFEISNTVIQIPDGATHLFVAAWDQLYGDNADPDGDYAVRITAFNNPTPYLNDFESVGSESAGLVASGTVSTLTRISLPTDSAGLGSPNQSMWLGRLGHNVAKSSTTPETVTLNLSGLVPGGLYNVAFDLLIGDSWDGSAGYYGPDRWSLTVLSGASTTTLLDATFSNCGVYNQLCGAWSPQTYSDATPLGGVSGPTFAPTTGADAAFDTNQDYSQDYAIYWFGHGAGNPMLTFTAGASTASLQFQRLPHAGGGDNPWEYWALDNVSVTAATTNIAGNTDYDAFVDFSFASNPTPDGLWRYGFTPTGAAGPLTLYTDHPISLDGLSKWYSAPAFDPNVTKNETGSDLWISGVLLFPATEFLVLHPGPNGERSVVRWTAPVAGTYQIAADFRGLRSDICGQTVDVHVLHNGTELYVDNISGGSDVRSFLGTRIVGLGDTVDFQVGRGPDSYACDSTGLKAIITLDPQTLTVTKDGGGTGTVTSAPSRIDCGATCAASFGSGTPVTLTATPADGSTFTGWSGDCNSSGQVTMTTDKACTATFALNTYTLTYTAGAGGTISGSTPQTVDYGANGTAVTALPNTGHHFTSWSDGSTTNPRTDTNVTADLTVTANFALNTYTLTYTAGAGGTISGSTPQTVDYGANGTAVTALPNTGHHFTSWSDGSTANPRTDLNVTANLSVTANFALDTYTLTYTAGANGSITGTSPQTVSYGGGGTLVEAVPNPGSGYSFINWSDGSTVNPRTDLNVTANLSVMANFADTVTCGDLMADGVEVLVSRNPIEEDVLIDCSTGVCQISTTKGTASCQRSYAIQRVSPPAAALGAATLAYPCNTAGGVNVGGQIITGLNSDGAANLGCGEGLFENISQVDSIIMPPGSWIATDGGLYLQWTHIGGRCAQKGGNDLVFENLTPNAPRPRLTCDRSLVGYGLTNTMEAVTDVAFEELGGSSCVLQTEFTRGVGNAVVDSNTTVESGACVKSEDQSPLSTLWGTEVEVTDGIIKFGENSCYAKTYKGKTTWISTNGSICPPR